MRIKRNNFVLKKPVFITNKTEERKICACVVQSKYGRITGDLKIDIPKIKNRFGI